MGADEIVGEGRSTGLLAVVAPPVVARRRRRLHPPVAAPSSADACNSLDELQAAPARAGKFPAEKDRQQSVLCDGNPEADVMSIGDVPGRDEDIEGKAFAGQNASAAGKDARGNRPVALASTKLHSISFRGGRRETARRPSGNPHVPALYPARHRALPAEFHPLPWGPSAQRLSGKSDGLLSLRGKWFDLQPGRRKFRCWQVFIPVTCCKQPGQKRLAWRDLLSFKEAIDAH